MNFTDNPRIVRVFMYLFSFFEQQFYSFICCIKTIYDFVSVLFYLQYSLIFVQFHVSLFLGGFFQALLISVFFFIIREQSLWLKKNPFASIIQPCDYFIIYDGIAYICLCMYIYSKLFFTFPICMQQTIKIYEHCQYPFTQYIL